MAQKLNQCQVNRTKNLTKNNRDMKKEGNYYVDENNNKWNCYIYTEEQAIKYSGTLNNCYNMINCSYCSNCSNCSYCSRCSYCSDCSRCSYCSNCSDCSRCSYCSDCSDCSNCSGCSNCSDFKTTPESITSPQIGSRNSQTTYYWNDEHEQIVCGCFKGTLEEFKTKIKKTHKDNEHSKAYFNWIERVEKYVNYEKGND